MEINWYGHSCFRLTERGLATVVTDPYDSAAIGYEPLKLKGDIVTVSHDTPGHNHLAAVKGYRMAITGAGEYEIGGVFITGVQTNGHTKPSATAFRNTLYLIEINGINILHLGDIDRVPNQTEVEGLGTVHVALVPVGGGGGLNAAKATEIISLLEPNIVIPMHYATQGTGNTVMKLDPLGKFLKEMGLSTIKPEPSLKLSGLNSLPEETKVIVLDYQKS